MSSPRAVILGALAASAVPAILLGAGAGVFTAPQAVQGEAVYREKCALCHGAQLEGGAGPALKGASFQALAVSKHFTARSLLETVARTMPLTAPASLSAEQYAQVTAFLLQQSGFPAGSRALSTTSAGLEAVDIAKAPGGVAAPAPAVAAVPPGAHLASAGVYTEAQAQRGKALYSDACLTCHGGELDGLEGAPPLAGKPFMDHWGGHPVTALSSYISTQMPPGNGGALGVSGETDVVAYILSKNAYPAGTTALSADSRQQADVVIDKK